MIEAGSGLNAVFEGKLGIIQGSVPAYREELFNLLHDRSTGGLEVFAGQSLDRATKSCERLSRATLRMTRNQALLPSPFTIIYQRGVIGWLETWQPDALICEANPRYITTPAAVRWMKNRKRPVLGWGLGTLMQAKGCAALRRFLRNRFLGAFDGLVCYGSVAKREYSVVGIDPEQLVVAWNSTARVGSTKPPERIRGGNDRAPVILFVGRINPGKKLPNLINAAGRLVQRRPLHLMIVGDGEPALINALRSQAAEQVPSAEFLGPKYGADLEDCFAAADLLVLPGLGGLAVQDGMARGLPVVVADGDGTQEDLVDVNTGWRVEPDNIGALTEALSDALSDLDGLQEKGAAAFCRVRDFINVDNMANQMICGINRIHTRVLGKV